jgi:hypothetical protein
VRWNGSIEDLHHSASAIHAPRLNATSALESHVTGSLDASAGVFLGTLHDDLNDTTLRKNLPVYGCVTQDIGTGIAMAEMTILHTRQKRTSAVDNYEQENSLILKKLELRTWEV